MKKSLLAILILTATVKNIYSIRQFIELVHHPLFSVRELKILILEPIYRKNITQTIGSIAVIIRQQKDSAHCAKCAVKPYNDKVEKFIRNNQLESLYYKQLLEVGEECLNAVRENLNKPRTSQDFSPAQLEFLEKKYSTLAKLLTKNFDDRSYIPYLFTRSQNKNQCTNFTKTCL